MLAVHDNFFVCHATTAECSNKQQHATTAVFKTKNSSLNEHEPQSRTLEWSTWHALDATILFLTIAIKEACRAAATHNHL